MKKTPQVILSGFADEAAPEKTLDQQFSAFAALGLSYFSIRFLEVGNGIKNVMQLSDVEINVVRAKLREYGLRVWSIGSPIGKVKLLDVADGTQNRFVAWDDYVRNDVRRACDLAEAFETRLIRGFSFYPPSGSRPQDHLAEVVDRVGQIASICEQRGLTFGLEVEANLVGCTGWTLAEIHRQVNHPALVLVFDGANLCVQDFSPKQIFEQYVAMKPGLGWLHVKDYAPAAKVNSEEARATGQVDEESLNQFVPVGQGSSAYAAVLADLRDFVPQLEQRLAARGIRGVCLELEPHLKKGGQFGGFSGADGCGVALRHLCQLLERSGLEYRLRDWPEITADRGER